MNEVMILLICFTIYSFIGWIIETTAISISEKHFVNRGFLNGPFIPVYGFGGVILELILGQLPKNVVLIFLGGVIITSTLEYFTGFLLETIFHAKWWDYSNFKINLKGRICLVNSLLFGLLAVALIFFIDPVVKSIVLNIPENVMITISIIVILYFILDISATIKSMNLLNSRLEKINLTMGDLKEKLGSNDSYESLDITQKKNKFNEMIADETLKKLSDTARASQEKLRSLINDNKFLQSRLLKAFPSLKSTKYPELLDIVKENIKNLGKIRRSNKKK